MVNVVHRVHRVQRAHGVRPVQFAPFGPEALKRRAARAGSNSAKAVERNKKRAPPGNTYKDSTGRCTNSLKLGMTAARGAVVMDSTSRGAVRGPRLQHGAL